jgi:hypothetical protein
VIQDRGVAMEEKLLWFLGRVLSGALMTPSKVLVGSSSGDEKAISAVGGFRLLPPTGGRSFVLALMAAATAACNSAVSGIVCARHSACILIHYQQKVVQLLAGIFCCYASGLGPGVHSLVVILH